MQPPQQRFRFTFQRRFAFSVGRYLLLQRLDGAVAGVHRRQRFVELSRPLAQLRLQPMVCWLNVRHAVGFARQQLGLSCGQRDRDAR